MAGSKKVLCIDDDQKILRMQQLMLEAAGFSVMTASTATIGLSLFQSCPVDAVIVDYEMPEMKGDQLAAAMKELKPGIPVMMFSALPWPPADASKCVDVFVSKCDPTTHWMDKIAQLVN